MRNHFFQLVDQLGWQQVVKDEIKKALQDHDSYAKFFKPLPGSDAAPNFSWETVWPLSADYALQLEEQLI